MNMFVYVKTRFVRADRKIIYIFFVARIFPPNLEPTQTNA